MEMDYIPKKFAVLPFILFQMIALCTNYYIVPQLVISKVCYKMFNHTVCSQLGQPKFKTQENHVYNEAAAWNALINFAGFFPSLIIILPLGAMADLVSKKNMLFIPAIANLISSLINLFSAMFVTLHMGFLVLASFATAFFAEMAGCTSLCCTYASCASSDDRTFVLTMVIASVEIGFGVGSLVGNYLKRYYGFTSVFLFAVITLFVSLLYALILIPPIDKFDEKQSQEDQHSIWNSVKEHTKNTFIHLLSFIKKYIFCSKDSTILLLFIATFFHLASYGGDRALVTFFLEHSPLNLRADKIGIYLTLYSFNRAIGLVILALVIRTYFRQSDYVLMFVGVLSMIVCFTILSFSKTTLMVYLSTIFAFPNSFMSPAVRSQLTKQVSAGEHAIILSFIGLLYGLGMFIMSVAANWLFVATVKIYSGFSILLMSFTNGISFLILCYVVFIKRGYQGKYAKKYSRIFTEGKMLKESNM